jgi:hypothetical protein
MKTTVDIPDKMLDTLMKNTKARTKREAILAAITEYNRKTNMAALSDMIGTFEEFMTTEELKSAREKS